MRILVSVLMLILHVAGAAAEEPVDYQVSKDLRIAQLIGETNFPVAVEPAIPKDFIAMSQSGTIDLSDWVYWGPKEVLEEYFKDPDSLSQAIIRLKLSTNTIQTGPESFDGKTMQECKSHFEKEFKGERAFERYQWGIYPVFALSTIQEFLKKRVCIHMAFVGLNAPEGRTLMVDFNFPGQRQQGSPSKEDLRIWETFLQNTEQLEEKDALLIHGQDIQKEHTLVCLPGMKAKVTAEKLAKDGSIQVVMNFQNPNLSFEFQDMADGYSGMEWMRGAPMVKIRGSFIVENENAKDVFIFTTSVLLKKVDAFSIDADTVNDRKDMFVYRKESGRKKSE